MGLLSRAGRAARDALVASSRDGNEWAALVHRGRLGRLVTDGERSAVSPPPRVAGVRDAEFHHTHPSTMPVRPLSMEDMRALILLAEKEPGWISKVYAHETAGGTSMAARSRRTRHGRARRALDEGAYAAGRHVQNDAEIGALRDYALGLAAKRQGLVGYGYEPGAQAADALALNHGAIRRASDAAYRAMHAPIHGLPYPFTWGGIGLGGAGLAGAGAAYGLSR